MNISNIFIITGQSGSGKSTALAAFEDAGYYCVDNLPVTLLPKFLEIPIEKDSHYKGLAFGMDLRERSFLMSYRSVFDELRQAGHRLEIIFLEADVATLTRRFSQTRRTHPLALGDKGVVDAINQERDELLALRNEDATRIIDSSSFNVHKLKKEISDLAADSCDGIRLKLAIVSFGFKYGIPEDADLMVDVRFLENPYFVPELKPHSGLSPAVRDFVLNGEGTRTFLTKYTDLLDFLIPMYQKEGKRYLTLAVGCTGGRHRSVAISTEIHNHLRGRFSDIRLLHRDIGQDE
ncbi:nucleotide-binding protein [Desulfoluna limicola]|uniref:Nucleotide-binding protein n=1 Tax=Desulfoluna limicola TaxID=2810562 RepID=A0ABN6EZ74_9BACT|nr:RNase adapter RapZ [Desulfoluna limicola]BCS94635.1 nucleotide-binding protein [Desulfoluna limicola]